ncbi:sensor histidine kinase [Streptomyces sp. NPDC002845]
MRTPSTRGCARGFAVGAMVMASIGDLGAAVDSRAPVWPVAVVLAVGLAAVLWPAGTPSGKRAGPPWLTVQARTAVPALVSIAYTVSSLVADWRAPFGPGEVAILLCLLFVAVRHCPPRWALTCGILDGGALLLTPVRFFGNPDEGAQAFQLLGLILIGLTAGIAGYSRSLDYRRTVAVGETRRAERLAIAADLHDFVAHHVTGILVQTQVARMMAATRPDELDPVLAGIEGAATEALASMRRTVGVLRDTGPEAADRRPVGDLAAVVGLTEGFAGPGQKVVLHRDPAVPDDLPHEVQAAAFRVVQEALTNVRRHAADATEISVVLRYDGRHLEAIVTDDGRGGTQLPEAARGGGFGLVGLTERVTALGGHLRTGPRPGHGWEVRAVFPVRKP